VLTEDWVKTPPLNENVCVVLSEARMIAMQEPLDE